MFDDFILLAKGGLTVYHGSVKKVEEYFAGIGIVVPDRVNPPDHFIDILEGIVKPSSGVTHEELPVRWMLHNGYPVPPDMLHHLDGIAASSAGPKPVMKRDQSFAADMWQDVKSNVVVKKDHLQHNFFTSNDLSDRITPGVVRQYRYFLGRYSIHYSILFNMHKNPNSLYWLLIHYWRYSTIPRSLSKFARVTYLFICNLLLGGLFLFVSFSGNFVNSRVKKGIL